MIEIASNDGYLLQITTQAGIPVLGIEPAANVAEVARRDHGVPTLARFFDSAAWRSSWPTAASRPTSCTPTTCWRTWPTSTGSSTGLRIVLKDSGVAVIEVPYVKDLVDQTEFDTIYHEHLCYFSLTSLKKLLERHDLVIHDVERIAIHGGSLRLFVGKQGEPSSRVAALLAEEQAWGVERAEFYQSLRPARRTAPPRAGRIAAQVEIRRPANRRLRCQRPRGARC